MHCQFCGTMLTANTLDCCPSCHPPGSRWAAGALAARLFGASPAVLLFWSIIGIAIGMFATDMIGAPLLVGFLVVALITFVAGG